MTFSACAISEKRFVFVFPSPKSLNIETKQAIMGVGLTLPQALHRRYECSKGAGWTRQRTSTLQPHLVTVRSELGLDLVVDLGGLLGLGERTASGLLALVVGSTLDLSSLLESVCTVLASES